jgi:hypothetical protein
MGANQLANEFWLSDRQWAALEPLIPTHRRGVKPKRNREIIQGPTQRMARNRRTNDIQADSLIPNPQPSTEPGQAYDNPVLYLSGLWIPLQQQGGHVPLHFLG